MITTAYQIFETTLQVRPDDIDMFNHVHNSRYLDYVLAARYEQMHADYGMSWEKFSEMGYGWVVSKVEIAFKRPLKLGDKFTVRTGILAIGEKGCSVQFEIIIQKTGKTASNGIFNYALIDLATLRSVAITDEMKRIYSI